MNSSHPPAAQVDDLQVLWGAKNIASFIGAPPRRVFYLLEKGLIPGKKTGNTWTSTKGQLRAHFSGEAIDAQS